MVHIVLAGGTGNVGREIVAELLKQRKHRVTVFSRRAAPDLVAQGIDVVVIDYLDLAALTEQLRGVDVVLSFIVTLLDPDNRAQRTLIDACRAAGVSRFAPSEWATASQSGIASYAGKDEVAAYLQQVIRDGPSRGSGGEMEWTLFQPGLFANYFTFPHRSAEHMTTFRMPVDFENGRALVLEHGDADVLTLTTVQDLARVVAAAVDSAEPWPEVSGMQGCRVSIRELIGLGEKIRGRSFEVTRLKKEDLEHGKIVADWVPLIEHPAVPEEARKEFSESYFSNFLLAIHAGAWDVSDEWNKRLPEFGFENTEDFLRKAWGKLDL